MTVRQDLTNWQPREIVLQASQQSLEAFVAGFGEYMLLVVLDEPNSELGMGLQVTEVRMGEADGLAFRTVVRDLDATMAGDRLTSANATSAKISMAASNTNGSDVIPRDFLQVPCHIVPIQKRTDRAFLQHVSVGRARNHDIVLRHRSVSKFHAWFELGEDNRLMVRDSDSRNHTFIDGQQISRRAEVAPGQQIRFGSVEARVCTSESVWLALQGRG